MPKRPTSSLDTIDYYLKQLRSHTDLGDQYAVFSGIVDGIVSDQYAAPAIMIARMRTAIAALRQVETERRTAPIADALAAALVACASCGDSLDDDNCDSSHTHVCK